MNIGTIFIVAAGAMLGALAGAAEIKTVEPADGEVVTLLTDSQKAFLDMSCERRREKFVDEDFRKNMGYPAERVPGERKARAAYCPKTVRLAWNALDGVDEYKVSVKDAKTGAIVVEQSVKGAATNVDNLEVAAEYEWSVTGGGATGGGRFKTEDRVPRLVRFPGMANVRDLGGWVGLGGRRVRQGLVFRSAGMNANADTGPNGTAPGKSWVEGENGEYIRKRFGIRTDIDLRTDEECSGMTGSPLGPDVKWFHCSSSAYGGMQDEKGREAFAKVFRVFLDEKNYPIDFHCISGADRTGSLAYIFCGLLGADEELLARDWETTGFWARGVGFCHAKRYDRLVDGFNKNFPAATTRERLEKYVVSLGFTEGDIEKFRSIMLEK